MPERLYIPQTDDTPEMEFDIEKPSFTISGRAFPENAHATFITVFRWLEEYKKNPKPLMIVDFKLIGYNTASAKQIMKLIILLKEFLEKSEVIIN
ncbi:MAG: DUF1987 family protein [Bacteroidia bacterium]|nr:DUF1987 family protein [Bacteroidia bacterium]